MRTVRSSTGSVDGSRDGFVTTMLCVIQTPACDEYGWALLVMLGIGRVLVCAAVSPMTMVVVAPKVAVVATTASSEASTSVAMATCLCGSNYLD